MITLTFRALSNDSMIFVRGTYFRICADGTLRGPDNAVAASYSGGLWQVARKQHRVLECPASVCLRVTTSDGQQKSVGPYQSLKVTGGEIFQMTSILALIRAKRRACRRSTSGERSSCYPRLEIVLRRPQTTYRSFTCGMPFESNGSHVPRSASKPKMLRAS